jgi:phosphatidylinositol alpha-1,6-mannosyltransferase
MRSASDTSTTGAPSGASTPGKVLLLARSFPPLEGGAERRYANLCRFFPPESIEVCTSWHERQAEFDRGEPFLIHRMPVPPHEERHPIGFARWTRWALSRVARGDIGVVWAGDLRPMDRIAWLLRRIRGVPYGLSFYGVDVTRELFRPEPSVWKRRLASRVFDEAAFFFANSAHMAGLVRELAARTRARPPGERLRVIRSGADLERFRLRGDARRARAEFGPELGLNGGGRTVLTVARLVPQKGIANALRAFALVSADYPDASYVIAGRGSQEEELRALVESLGLAGRVRLLGPVPYERMPLLHAAADVFLLTSRRTPRWTENFPNACLEAMATGKPVIAGDVGGVPEMVRHGETGFLVDPEDPRAIAAALGRLLADPALAGAMGAAGRAYVERELTHERAAREFYQLLSSVSRLPLPPWHRPLRGQGDALQPGPPGPSPSPA